MNRFILYLTCFTLLLAGCMGISLSVPLEAPAVFLMGVVGILAALAMFRGGPRWISLRGGIGISLAAILYFVLRAAISPVWDLGMEDLMLILPASLLYIVAGYAVSGRAGAQLRQGLALMIVLLMLAHIGSVLMQLDGGDGYSLNRYFSSSSRSSQQHITGMYGYMGSFANFSVIAGLLSLSLGMWGRFRYGVRAILLAIGLMALGLAVCAQSRSAVLSLAVSLVVYGGLFYISLEHLNGRVKSQIRKWLLAVGIIGLLAGGIGGVWVFTQRGSSGLDEITSSDVRTQFWAMAAEQWADHPIVGGGSRSYSYQSFRYWSPNLRTDQENPEFVHNEYLQLMADYGIIGLLFIVALLVGHLILGTKQVCKISKLLGEDGIQKGSNAMALAIAGVSGMVAMMVHIVFDFRTHLLANLLLLVCCAVWTLPLLGKAENGGWRMKNGCISGILLLLGLMTLFLGVKQLRSGWPLIINKMAKEDGSWNPLEVPREQWISVLEESIESEPHYRRYQRLGTLYRLNASSEEDGGKEKSISAYLSSIERHSENPIPWINLAGIYAEAGEFERSDKAYLAASEMAKSREPWFHMHLQWGEMHEHWALSLWKRGKFEQSEVHFLRAKELYHLNYKYENFNGNKQWGIAYSNLMIIYARQLDAQEKHVQAESVYKELLKLPHWYDLKKETQLHYYYGEHLYKHGKWIWFQRKPEQALVMMKKAKKILLESRAVRPEKIEKSKLELLADIQKIIDFLSQAGVRD